MARKAQYVLDIEDAIREIRGKVKRHEEYFKREEHTRYALIDPMLKALGWDVSNPDQVRVEYRTRTAQEDSRRVDYALFLDKSKRPVVIVEAKSITRGDIEYAHTGIIHDLDVEEVCWTQWQKKAVEQLEGYSHGLGARYGVLTNGDFWGIYKLRSKRTPFEQRQIDNFPIANIPIEQSAEKLLRLHRRKLLKEVRQDMHP